ncbi:MAG: glycine zipper 2TM domain-containing protein [Panacagrimonas sp.]
MKQQIFKGLMLGGLFAGSAVAQTDHATPYQPQAELEYAEVVSAQPKYRNVRVSEPRTECWDEAVTANTNPLSANQWLNQGTAGAVIGAIAGGVVGHQFGGGSGQDVATIAGALIGAGLGHKVANQNFHRSVQQTTPTTIYEERCRTIENTRVEQRLDGYDVTYRFGGRLYHTAMQQHPGSRIAVNVNVAPATNPYQSVSY